MSVDSTSRQPARRAAARWRLVLLLPAVVLAGLGGCTQSAVVGRSTVATDAGPFDGAPGFIDGRLHAHAVFDSVGEIYWFGGDNDPSRITFYFFEKHPTCAELSTPGWVTRVRPTDLMGITIGGATPGTYPVVPETPPRLGNAYILHEIDQTDPVIDSVGETGSVTITSVKPDATVTGTMNATFSTGSLDGAFSATWCATGVGL